MATYKRYQRGTHEAGTVVIRLAREDDEVQAFVRTLGDPEDDSPDVAYVSEMTTPEDAFRLAESRIQGSPKAEIVVEMEAGVEWNSDWGTLA